MRWPFQLLDTAAALPPAALTRPRQEASAAVCRGVCDREDVTVRAAAVLLVDRLHRLDSRSRRPLRILQKIDCRDAASLDLLRRPDHQGRRPGPLPEQVISDIFLDNLKTGTPGS